mmetsp:Transcript_37203/g.88107  ORF Transcript_37203/g.88107 Transcript_37203/m.88107 type:complete len:151 (+) Transcript_37203:113-565(+)
MMILGMAENAVRVKVKAKEARRKKILQTGSRRVRYLHFKGRREEAMEEETRDAYRARLSRLIAVMSTWLEAQAEVNAMEGKPRFVEALEGDGVKIPDPVLEQSQIVTPLAMGVIVEGPINPWEPLMKATVVSGVHKSENQMLITSFFTRA